MGVKGPFLLEFLKAEFSKALMKSRSCLGPK